jgi:transcription elongation factor Elf1
MDPCSPADSGLRFACPRCGHEAADDYEVIEPQVPARWRCGACATAFSVLLLECEGCGTESVEVALHASEHTALADMTCRACGQPRVSHEAALASAE